MSCQSQDGKTRLRPRKRRVFDSCTVASRLSGRCAAAPLCRDTRDVSTALHRRVGRGARVRQWFIGERVKSLLTKDVDGPEHST
jgi:hypothetical protein